MSQTNDEASIVRESQRSESEARSIIHDLDRLYTLPEERKCRWVWELLQNAKDVAEPNGVDIVFELSNNKIIFSHNGQPFTTKNLLALLYKTSTKSLGGQEGTTGKYGTGFITTHILNKKLTIQGIHQNDVGRRHFELNINRSYESNKENELLQIVQDSLKETFESINKITQLAPQEIYENRNSFIYELTADSFIYAEKGISELEKNIAFTLLINSDSAKRINSVTIKRNDNKVAYRTKIEDTKIEGIKFVSTSSDSGILFCKSDKLVFGVLAKKSLEEFEIFPIENQAILFKEFPLLGTENFNLPALIYHKDFHPTEERDGVRTKKIKESEEDNTADLNRKALTEFISNYISFAQSLIQAKFSALHHLTKSGLPDFVESYSNIDWYKEHIQKPLRDFILQQNIVRTYSGGFIKVTEAVFPIIELREDADFYSLLATLIPDKVPDKKSIGKWIEIINQNSEDWPSEITIDIKMMVAKIPDYINLLADKYTWLKQLYNYLEIKSFSYLGESIPIYLNELNQLRLRDDVKIHPFIENDFKVISKVIGRDLDTEFLNRNLGAISAIKEFNLEEFYGYLNKEIGALNPDVATMEQIESILKICSLFKTDRAQKRNKWFEIIKQLLPNLVQEKKYISIDYESFWSSSEKWCIKYVCTLIEKSQKPSEFATLHFQNHLTSCFEWLTNFITYVFELDDDFRPIILKRKIIPTQSDEFKPYDESIFAEENPEYFNEVIKDIYKSYSSSKKDPRTFIIDNRISFRGFRSKDVDILTSEIDKIFQDKAIESKVKKGEPLNEMFLRLNDWFEKFDSKGTYLRTFSSIRASLYVLALGEGFSKQIMEITNSGKTMEEIVALAKINLSSQEMQSLENAALIVGKDKLLAKAQEMIKSNEQITRWKRIGNAAENAFKKVISNINPSIDVGNPDEGKDFELLLKAKGYSIEIKNVIQGKENVRMSILQGRTAVNEKEHYALCVMTRPNDTEAIDEIYFREHSRFVTDIGYKIGDKISRWDEGIRDLIKDEDIKVSLDDKTESVYINRNIWQGGITFYEFVTLLENFFALNETN